MESKIDLVMWTKNGARTLPFVLRRINAVIPAEAINKRLIVDDQSDDCTRELANQFGWEVIPNEGTGISDGANTALRYVETEYFVSFEQDLLLASNWWLKVPRLLSESGVVVASGIRFVDYPSGLKKIQEYSAERVSKTDGKERYSPSLKTIDNTIYETNVIRRLGGFPRLPSSVGIDYALSQRIFTAGFKWRVDYTTTSVHLRTGLRGELIHNYWYGNCSDELERSMFHRNASFRRMLLRFVFSPVRGLQIAAKKKSPEAIYIYPLIRLSHLRGVMDGRRIAASCSTSHA